MYDPHYDSWWRWELEIRMYIWRAWHEMMQSKPIKPVKQQQWHMHRAPRRIMRSVNRNSF